MQYGDFWYEIDLSKFGEREVADQYWFDSCLYVGADLVTMIAKVCQKYD